VFFLEIQGKIVYNDCGDFMGTKTNAIRLVTQAGIPCRECFYEYDESDLSGTHAADAIGMPQEQVFKTLVTRGERTGIQVFCIPVCCELDLKKAAKVAGDKSIALVPVKELLNLTGYIRGGCSPVGMKRNYPTHFDETCILYDEIAVSAGERGHQIILNPEALADFVDADLADITI
jgi:Cys-tRNA(Pro)/Cys-tRNA(Cys) deacylase